MVFGKQQNMKRQAFEIYEFNLLLGDSHAFKLILN